MFKEDDTISYKITSLFIYTMFKEDDTISYKITSLPCGPLKYKQTMYIYIFTRKTML